MGLIHKYDGFDWDGGNIRKNWEGHRVSREEIEQVFSNRPWFDYEATGYIGTEKRRIVLGKTDKGRSLFIVYTERNNRIRPISARDMHQKERNIYDEKVKANS
jgi:uncharacterized DUF497 family protein